MSLKRIWGKFFVVFFFKANFSIRSIQCSPSSGQRKKHQNINWQLPKTALLWEKGLSNSITWHHCGIRVRCCTGTEVNRDRYHHPVSAPIPASGRKPSSLHWGPVLSAGPLQGPAPCPHSTALDVIPKKSATIQVFSVKILQQKSTLVDLQCWWTYIQVPKDQEYTQQAWKGSCSIGVMYFGSTNIVSAVTSAWMSLKSLAKWNQCHWSVWSHKNQAVGRMQTSLNMSPCTALSTTYKFSVLPSASLLACGQPWAKLFLC